MAKCLVNYQVLYKLLAIKFLVLGLVEDTKCNLHLQGTYHLVDGGEWHE